MKHFIFVCVVTFLFIVIMSGSMLAFFAIMAIILTAKRFKSSWLSLYRFSLKVLNTLA